MEDQQQPRITIEQIEGEKCLIFTKGSGKEILKGARDAFFMWFVLIAPVAMVISAFFFDLIDSLLWKVLPGSIVTLIGCYWGALRFLKYDHISGIYCFSIKGNNYRLWRKVHPDRKPVEGDKKTIRLCYWKPHTWEVKIKNEGSTLYKASELTKGEADIARNYFKDRDIETSNSS